MLIVDVAMLFTMAVVVVMFFKKKPLVWHVVDTIITFSFMIYLNFELPFNVE